MTDSRTPDSLTKLSPRLQYWRKHGGEESPYTAIVDHVKAHGLPGSGEVTALSRELCIPEATIRGVATYYADLTVPDGACTVCEGTSCQLNGGPDLRRKLEKEGKVCRGAYCLGYCDRSPVFLDEARDLNISGRPTNLPDVRNVAPRPLVTGRLLQGGASTLARALELGAYDGLEEALGHSPEHLLDLVDESGERGRGGAGFSTGIKWRSAARTPADQRYVIANGDEGDPGSFVDRALMEEDPHGILEGMILCGYATAATKGIVYIRSEYPQAIETMREAIREATADGILGQDLYSSGFDFEVTVIPGHGSYVCGEESAMINAIEGLRGEVQLRPPYPSEEGVYGKPTVVNNVETLLNIPMIVREGPEAFANLGTHASNGTKVLSLNHGFARPGLVEVEFGITLHEVIHEIAGGARDGQPLAAVLVGGPMGSVVLPEQWDLPVCYDVLERNDIQFGHGGIVAVPEGSDFRALLQHWIQFMIDESCGKCVPCRLGSQCAANALTSLRDETAARARLDEIFTAMESGSLCAFGQFMPGPMRKLIQHFGNRIFTS